MSEEKYLSFYRENAECDVVCEKAKINIQTGSINRMLDIFNAVIMQWCMRQRMDFFRTNVLDAYYDINRL